MTRLLDIARALRVGNLTLSVSTLWLVRCVLVVPLLELAGRTSALDGPGFAALTLSVVLVMLGGYLINDHFDRRIDRGHKRSAVSVLGLDSDRAFSIYLWLTGAGIAFGAVAAMRSGDLGRVTIVVLAAITLWVYAAYLSRNKLVGNLVVAGLVGLNVLVPVLFERDLTGLARAHPVVAGAILYTAALFAGFAVWVNLLREVAKDVEDMEVDRRGERTSIPLRFGLLTTRRLLTGGLILLLAAVFRTIIWMDDAGRSTLAVATGITCLVIAAWVAGLLYAARDPAGYRSVQNAFKLILVIGLALLILIPF